jgi:hypothetical protein
MTGNNGPSEEVKNLTKLGGRLVVRGFFLISCGLVLLLLIGFGPKSPIADALFLICMINGILFLISGLVANFKASQMLEEEFTQSQLQFTNHLLEGMTKIAKKTNQRK